MRRSSSSKLYVSLQLSSVALMSERALSVPRKGEIGSIFAPSFDLADSGTAVATRPGLPGSTGTNVASNKPQD